HPHSSRSGGTTAWQGGQRTDVGDQRTESTSHFSPITNHFFVPLLLFIWLVAVEIAVETWYRMHERGTIATPAWSVRWPEDAPGYREIKTDERVRESLRCGPMPIIVCTRTGCTPQRRTGKICIPTGTWPIAGAW